jgi:hypothetical protein
MLVSQDGQDVAPTRHPSRPRPRVDASARCRELAGPGPGAGRVRGLSEIGDDPVVVAGPDAPDRLVKQPVTTQNLEQRSVSPGNHEHVVDAARDCGGDLPGPDQGFSA